MKSTLVQLPGGYVDSKGRIHCEAELIPLSGKDEECLAESQVKESASLITIMLSRCVRRIGDIESVTSEMTGKLLVADRQFLMLKLREMTFGDQVQGTLFCPWPNCGKKVDISFSTKDIPIVASKDKGPTYTVNLLLGEGEECEETKGRLEIVFRLPNGEDQEVVAPYLFENEARALTLLLRRCVVEIFPTQGDMDECIDTLSPKAKLEFQKTMEGVAPKVELDLDAQCPECGRSFSTPFDLQSFFFGEWRINRDLLYREIHSLAYHYHWSEKEIMDMPREKRRKYIDVLGEELERLNNAI